MNISDAVEKMRYSMTGGVLRIDVDI